MSIIVIGDTIIDEFVLVNMLGNNPDDNGKTRYLMPQLHNLHIEGGGALNVAENICHMGGVVTYYGYYTYALSKFLNSKLHNGKSLLIDNVKRIRRFVDKQTNEHLIRLDTPTEYTMLDLPPVSLLKNAEVIILSDYLHGSVYSTIVDHIQKHCSAQIIIDSRDPRGWHGVRDCIFKLNQKEWNMLGDGFKQVNTEVNTFIITNGPKAIEVREPGARSIKIIVPKVDSVDTTGAGDVFVAMLAMQLADKVERRKAIGEAGRVATISTTLPGTTKLSTVSIHGRPGKNTNSIPKTKTKDKKNGVGKSHISKTTEVVEIDNGKRIQEAFKDNPVHIPVRPKSRTRNKKKDTTKTGSRKDRGK